MIHDALCVASLALNGVLVAATIYFAHGKLKAYRLARLWMTTSHQMQRAAARTHPLNPTLESTFAALQLAANAGIEVEYRP